MKHKPFTRILSLLLAMTTLFSLLAVPASAASLNDSGTVTIQYLGRKEYLSKSTGGSLSGSSWTYTSNDGLSGTAYCVNWGLSAVSPNKALTLQEYNRNPQTMGVFANGYPNRTLAQFKELHADDVRGIANLTEDEYKYATQVAVWASCGQLAVSGTSFTAGRASLVEPTSDAHPRQGVPPRSRQRNGASDTSSLLSGRRSVKASRAPLARSLHTVVYKLAELFRLSDHAV